MVNKRLIKEKAFFKLSYVNYAYRRIEGLCAYKAPLNAYTLSAHKVLRVL